MTGTPEITSADVTILPDEWDRPVAVLPDEAAAALTAASREDVMDYGDCFRSRRFPADAWTTRILRAIFEAVLAEHPDTPGLTHYRVCNGGSFYGYVVGESAWNAAERTWTDYEKLRRLIPYGSFHVYHDGTSQFGD